MTPTLCLVTGANGFVGRALCAEMACRGLPLRAALRHAAGPQTVGVGAIDGDTDWRAALSGCDTVVHLAAQAHQAAGDLQRLQATNVHGVLNLARQAQAAGVRRLVFLSSIKAWGETTLPGEAARESDACHPQDAYGRSKCSAEQGLRALPQDGGMDIVIVRPPLVYGPGARANFAALQRAVQRGWPLPLGAVRNARSFIALDNLVDFLILCARHPAAAQHTFHVSDGADLSSPDLVRAMAQAAGVPARLWPLPPILLRAAARIVGRGAAAQRLLGNLQLDIGKARTLLDWHPPLTLQEGMRRAFTERPQP